MEPRIRYAKTSDGVNIAYWTYGAGVPLVITPYHVFSNVELEWGWKAQRDIFQRLATQCKVVRYDPRGVGLSERRIELTPETQRLDLQAVVEAVGPHLALLGRGFSGPAAIRYAAAHSRNISHVILYDTAASTSAMMNDRGPSVEVQIAINRAMLNREDAELLVRFRESSHSVEPEYWERAMALENDASEILDSVRCPSLVIAERWPGQKIDRAMHLSSGLPNAELVVIDRQPGDPWPDWADVASQVFEFLGLETPEDNGVPTGTIIAAPSGTATILFTDIVDSTALTERLGDAPFRAKARDLDGALRGIIGEHAGTPIEGKLLGDGVLATFMSARQAIEAALACGKAGNDAGLPLHLGLHAGDVIREDNNVYGGAVNIASRISGLSAPGEVLVSDTVRSLARTSAGVRFEDRGEQSLKGVGEPVRVWAVREGE